MSDAWNHALLVIGLFAAWAVALAFIGGSKIFWDFESHPDETAR
jgi:hypothetical protein